MLNFQIGNGKITFKCDETVRGFRSRSVHAPAWVEDSALISVAEVVVLLCTKGAKTSYIGRFDAAKFILSHVAKLRLSFPPVDDDWNNFIVTHYATHLTDATSQPKTRFASWSAVANIYKALKRSGFIPADVFIPDSSAKGVSQPEAMTQPFGYGTLHTPIPKSTKFLLPKKYLVEEDLDLEDDVYLLKLMNTLQARANSIVECTVDYWDRMLRCHAKGNELCKNISVDEIETVLKNKSFFKDGIHLAHPDTSEGLSWFLAVTRYYAEYTDEPKVINLTELKKIPFFRPIINNAVSKTKLVEKIWEAAGDDGINNQTVTETLNRLLGYLSPRDCAVASVIIASENPNFNPTSLTNIRLYRHDGKYFLRANSDTKKITISVSKPRARSRKISVLPPLSTKIVMDVIRCTSMPRRRLIAEGKSGWRKLFLISTNCQVGSNPVFTAFLVNTKGTSLYDIYKDKLEAVGVAPSMLNLYKIRCTQGLLKFLQTGSLQAVADLLGNSLQVVRKNYIPAWMIHRWAVRFFRVLHQKIMLVATEAEPWQLAASDFTSQDELKTFVRRVLLGLKQGDPLSQALQERLGHYAPDPSSVIEMFVERELLFDRSPKSLAAIYAYAEAVDALQPEDRLRSDEGTNVPLWVFPTIRDLVVKTIRLDFDGASNAEMAIADRVSGDSMSELRKSHARANILKKEYLPLVSVFNRRQS